MIKHSGSSPAFPFFLDTKSGKRFCIHHISPPDRECLGTFIYLHPFAEEMNKSRRMVALQAREFVDLGYGVLQIDLFGCGDSDGEFREARWDIWLQDITEIINWLKDKTTSPISLWGLRMGALLALDFKKNCDPDNQIDHIMMWQPIINGKAFLNQFLRLQLASVFLSGNTKDKSSVNVLRNILSSGSILEIGGYELAPELAEAFDHLEMAELITTANKVLWLDIVTNVSNSISPVKQKIKDAWEKEENNLHFITVPGLPFWATQEITECPELISATSKLFIKN